MKQILIALSLLVSSSLSAQAVKDSTKQTKTPTKSACDCIYPLAKNVDNIDWCIGSKGGKYCINRKGTKTYRSSIVNR